MGLLPLDLPRFVPDDRYTLAQWQAIERGTGKRYEYHDGLLVSVEAMAGGSFQHSVLAGNVIGEVRNAIVAAERADGRFAGCNALASDLRIAVDGGTRYLYADAAVVCGRPVYDASIATAIVNPTVVVEVLSPSSEGYDRGLKFDFYGALATLREYVIVEQERRRVEVRYRADAGAPWRYDIHTEAGETAGLPSLGVELPLDGVYRNWEAPEVKR